MQEVDEPKQEAPEVPAEGEAVEAGTSEPAEAPAESDTPDGGVNTA